jgi:predicted DNA-binding transcriptional regulator AlpA
MTSTYTPGNKYSKRVSIAEAAVTWQGLSTELQTNVTLNTRGLPVLSGCPDLLERAEGILNAAQDGLITGSVQNEDGYPLAPAHMRLDRPSLATWISDIQKELGEDKVRKPPIDGTSISNLLKFSEVCARLNISESNLKRLIKTSQFPTATHTGPNRWPESDVNVYLAKKIINRVAKNFIPSNENN